LPKRKPELIINRCVLSEFHSHVSLIIFNRTRRLVSVLWRRRRKLQDRPLRLGKRLPERKRPTSWPNRKRKEPF
jgi:hypothetical protein